MTWPCWVPRGGLRLHHLHEPGPLAPEIDQAIIDGNLIVGSCFGTDFEGRVHNLVKGSYLGSPPLVVAYAIAGTIDIDLTLEPLGQDRDGNDVYLKDIWPTDAELKETVSSSINPEMFRARYSDVLNEPRWDGIEVEDSDLYPWNPASTYVQLPSFFTGITPDIAPIQPIHDARVLLKLGDSVTTDHISPAGSIPASGPAGRYLQEKGVEPKTSEPGSRRATTK